MGGIPHSKITPKCRTRTEQFVGIVNIFYSCKLRLMCESYNQRYVLAEFVCADEMFKGKP